MDVIEISTKQIKSPIIFNDIKSAYKKLLVNNNIAKNHTLEMSKSFNFKVSFRIYFYAIISKVYIFWKFPAASSVHNHIKTTIQ